MDADCAQRRGADDPRRCCETFYTRHVEEEENDPERLAEEAVVRMVKVPDTTAFVPEAVFVKLKEASPRPPLTASISA
jgi:hypothetical protein